MADMTKQVLKHQKDVLVDGEEVQATLHIAPHGLIKDAAIAGGLAGSLGSAGAAAGMRSGGNKAAARMADGQDGISMAGTFPAVPGLLCLTNQRILVFQRASVQSHKPVGIVAEYPRDAITNYHLKGGFMKKDLTLDFKDGSTLKLDAGIGQPFKKFEAAMAA